MIGGPELERIAARGWRGLVEEPLGDWIMRAGNGFTGRANSALAMGDPGLPLEPALDRVVGFYRVHGLPPRLQVPIDGDDPLGAQLATRGWQPFNESVVLVGAVRPGAELPPGWRAEFADRPDDRWLAGYHYRGRPLPPGAVAVLVNADAPTFLTVTAAGALLGVARGIVTDGWLGVTALTVEPAHRRRGVGSVLMAQLQRWAADRGATDVYLQVAAENDAALAMYDRAGFVEHHRYRYWRR